MRAQIESSEPATKVEFVQILQDMIGDLSNQPEPVVIRLYSQDGKLLNETGPRVADAISKVPGVVDILNGVEDAISGPAVTFQINPAPRLRGPDFTPEEIAVDASAILEGEPAATPVILNDRSYTDSRSISGSEPRVSRTNDQYAAGECHGKDRNARLSGERRE